MTRASELPFTLEQFRAWVEQQPGEIVGISRGSVYRVLAFVDDSPVSKWASAQLGRKVSLMGGYVRAVPSQVVMRGVELPRWMFELDRWCNRKRTTPILKAELLAKIQELLRPTPPRSPSRLHEWWESLWRNPHPLVPSTPATSRSNSGDQPNAGPEAEA